jgi:hypothetical protein
MSALLSRAAKKAKWAEKLRGQLGSRFNQTLFYHGDKGEQRVLKVASKGPFRKWGTFFTTQEVGTRAVQGAANYAAPVGTPVGRVHRARLRYDSPLDMAHLKELDRLRMVRTLRATRQLLERRAKYRGLGTELRKQPSQLAATTAKQVGILEKQWSTTPALAKKWGTPALETDFGSFLAPGRRAVQRPDVAYHLVTATVNKAPRGILRRAGYDALKGVPGEAPNETIIPGLFTKSTKRYKRNYWPMGWRDYARGDSGNFYSPLVPLGKWRY